VTLSPDTMDDTDVSGAGMYFPPNSGNFVTLRTLLGGAVFPSVNVMSPPFNATGGGVVPDSAAINAAAASLTGGGVLVLPSAHTFLLNDTIKLHGNTVMWAYGAIITCTSSASWITPPFAGVLFGFQNANWGASVITDQNITILGGYFNWSPQPTSHIINLRSVRNALVRDIRTLGGGDSVAHLRCDGSAVERCYLENFSNCGADHYDSPQNGIVRDCIIRTTTASQMVNFNAIAVDGSVGHGEGFLLEGNTVESTEATATPIQLEPLGAGGSGSTITNVKVIGNKFKNVWLVCRGNISDYQVAFNTFKGFLNASQAIVFNTVSPDVPDGVSVAFNTIEDATTTTGLGVVQIVATDWQFVYNQILGNGYTAPGLGAPTNPGTVFGNIISNGLVNLGVNTVGTFGFNMANNQILGLFNSGGTGRVKLLLQSDNNLVLRGIAGDGVSERVLFAITQNSDTSDFRFAPTVTMGTAGANNIRVTGAGTGNNPKMQALGSDTDVYLSLAGQGARGVKGNLTTTAAIPNTGNLAAGEWGIYKNSSSGAVVLAVNDAGSIKTVALT